MNFITKAGAIAALGCALSASAQDPWLHVYYPKGTDFKQFDMTNVTSITFDEELGTMHVTDDSGETATVVASAVERFVIGANTPRLTITTEEDVEEVYSKEIYLNGTAVFEGMGIYDDFTSPVQIRGRGNSTWGYSKKPYRLKFPEKIKVGPVKKGKNLILLANYIDEAMMRNEVAFLAEQLVGMPWPHHAMPVDVWFNGIYKGSYMACEKTGFNNASVDLSKEDEARSIMFELDTNSASDDEFPFDSEYFDDDRAAYFPVRIKDPDAPEDLTEQAAWLSKWEADFNNFMRVVAEGTEEQIFAACDVETLVRYIIVNNICCNQELNHPKSVFLYKTEGGKYMFGPGWDFDWAFGYQPTYTKGNSGSSWGWGWGETYPSYENPLLGYGHSESISADGNGGLFYYKLCNTTTFRNIYNEVWADFYNNRLTEFWELFDAYAEALRPSANRQGLDRSRYQNFDSNVEALRQWVANRIEYINTDANHALWEDGTFDK